MTPAEYQELLQTFSLGNGTNIDYLRTSIALSLIGLFSVWMMWTCWKHYELFGKKSIELSDLLWAWGKTVILYTVFIVTVIVYVSI